MVRFCTIPGCKKEFAARGLCTTHWARAKADGTLGALPIERLPRKAQCEVERCKSKPVGRGFCAKHYQRFMANGSMELSRAENGEPLAFLMRHIDWNADACLIWPFARNQDGYGQIFYRGSVTRAHRVMCMFVHGDPPFPDAKALHNCGKGHDGCFHPQHVRWGTQQENSDDKRAHGTAGRLGQEVVRAIFADRRPTPEVMKEYGVSRTHVDNIRAGRRWAWLTSAKE